jgi:phosphoribosylanthranilate isomerase
MSGVIKICGVKTAEAMDAAARAGATHIGFNFYPKSPRFISPEEAGRLAARAPGLRNVALTVDADDETLHAISAGLHPQMWQLHGDETPERVSAIRNQFRVPVMKAVSIESKVDVARAYTYEQCADWLLFDAKPGALPGGNGLAFDWHLIAEETWTKPWFLSGGLTPGNVAEAIHTAYARGVDVSSGVEKARGEKDPALIEDFVLRARAAFAESFKR